MKMEFIGRENELNELREAYGKPYGQNILIYGRRRVGKTSLIRESLKFFNGKIVSFVGLENVSLEANTRELEKKIKEVFQVPYLHFEDFSSLLEYLYRQAKQENVLLILDEFPFLMEKESGILSMIQIQVDKYQKNSHLNIIFSGSSFGKMKEIVDHSSPLFGRFNRIIHLNSFDYYDAAKWAKGLTNEEKFSFYAVFGGLPYYLDNIDYSDSLEGNIKKLLLKSGSLFENEIKSTILREIEKDSRSFNVLNLIANGKHTYAAINESLDGKGDGKATYALKKLLEERTIEKLVPINFSSDKKSSYYIYDPLLEFYFNFVYPLESERAYMNVNNVFDLIKEKLYKNFLPRQFEKVAKEFLIRMNRLGKIEPPFRDIGHYCYYDIKGKKNLEFDVATKNRDGYVDYECKYLDRKIDNKIVYNEISDCKQRNIPFVQYGFISKMGFESNVSDDVCQYSLDDMYSMIAK